MQPPAPPPGSGDTPGWRRDQPAPPPPPAYGGYQQPAPPGYQAYGQPVYGGGGGEHPQGTTILVLGILSLVVCQILGPFAWSMGSKALEEIDGSGRSYTNRGNVVAGKICGMISTILLIVSVVFVVIVVIATAASGS